MHALSLKRVASWKQSRTPRIHFAGRFEKIAVDRRSVGAAARRPLASRSETRELWIELGAGFTAA
jgi:hypothetical protein